MKLCNSLWNRTAQSLVTGNCISSTSELCSPQISQRALLENRRCTFLSNNVAYVSNFDMKTSISAPLILGMHVRNPNPNLVSTNLYKSDSYSSFSHSSLELWPSSRVQGYLDSICVDFPGKFLKCHLLSLLSLFCLQMSFCLVLLVTSSVYVIINLYKCRFSLLSFFTHVTSHFLSFHLSTITIVGYIYACMFFSLHNLVCSMFVTNLSDPFANLHPSHLQ